MFLKTLTLKGFKSFADTTTLELEPGITVVVGPNGSGKSNIVDAVAWVLGAQGPRTVRSSKMEDVIFAGTSRRAALGRAEVSLTIDNSAGLIPIAFTEVTITRTLFRSGDSEYAINGAPCRLLDIQELLSDTGVGRQQHVIVSQGQLDAVLNAQAGDRRLIIEEAAGVLKYRRRREKAQRRLDATEADLLRVQDLLREVRRQLRPLERQADAARRHGQVVEELDALRRFLAGRELTSLETRSALAATTRREQGVAEGLLVSRLAGLDADLADAEAALAAAEGLAAPDGGLAAPERPDDRPEIPRTAPRARRDRLADAVARAEGLRERARGLSALVAERHRSLERLRNAGVDADLVASLEAEATELAGSLDAVDGDAERLTPELAELVEAEGEVAAERRQFEADGAADEPVAADDDAGAGGPAGADAGQWPATAAEVRGELAALRQAGDRGGAERRRLEERRAALAARVERVEAEAAQVAAELDRGRSASEGLAAAAADAAVARAAAETALEAADAAEAAATGAHQAWVARAETLAAALHEARARAGAERLAHLDGLVGTLLDVVDVDAGWEAAFEAAIGEAVAAVVVSGEEAARQALAHLHAEGVGGAVLALGALMAGAGRAPASGPGAGDGVARELRELCASRPGIEPLRAHARASSPEADGLLDRLLVGAVAVEGGWSEALDAALAAPGLVVVTRQGDRFATTGWRAGAGGGGATGAALEEARRNVEATAGELAVASVERIRARDRAAEARDVDSGAARVVDRHQARLLELSRSAERAGRERRDAAQELDASGPHLAELVVRLQRDQTRSEELAALLPGLEAEEAAGIERAAAHRARRARLEQREAALRALRTDLEVRAAGLEERRTLLRRRQVEVERRLVGMIAEREAAEARRLELTGQVAAVARLGRLLGEQTAVLDAHVAAVVAARREHEERTAGLASRLDGLRRSRTAAERDLVATRERLQQAELEQAELRVRLETALESLEQDLGVTAEAARTTPCPELPTGTTAEARARELDRELRLMGPINPLALEEHTALLERHTFLEAQLEDVKAGRRELAKVIRAIDQEIVDVFSAAFADVAENFTALFSTLFPGGVGRLQLTDPDNLLDTGIEVEARPSGKNVKRLSLLSGGERSLTAMAFLFAVFRSRPSPFYLMDEVEAALDDVNLHRFLDLIREFRTEAQLLIVSHQKRTMEAADCLYGVTMQPGGSSRVLSERITAPAGCMVTP